ncbi:alpha-latroinsectotoxin-Lt1a [Artemisia annua]|uniref:Alpha-latroinsectotoxin-Lt1a n=1 Tax=Artemisia annua TaxID=35608 RepID=A0A2U1P9X3_ARTAN|nr:alpha-latroinsectotoxin-Lt1a [Artemisia annua]
MASHLGHVLVVRWLLKYTIYTGVFDVEYFQKFMWTPNGMNKTALDVAFEEGHVEVAKLLLENSLQRLVSKRNNEGKLLVSMLCNPEHDNIILDTFEKATNAVMHPLAIKSITIHEEEDPRQGSPQAYINSIMLSRIHNHTKIRLGSLWKSLIKKFLSLQILSTTSMKPDLPCCGKKCETKSFEGPQGKTALHAAAISGSKECIKYLLREEIDQKIRDEHGWTPLRYAVHHNNASATAELVNADPSIVNEIMKEDGINTFAVHIAASRGYCETLKVLMSHCPGCSELVDGKGKNIFHVAVENKKTEVIELIYRDESYTSLVNEKDKDGNTPMHLLMASDLEMMEVAIDYRVNINAMNNEKRTPLDMASSSEKRKRLLEVYIFILD